MTAIIKATHSFGSEFDPVVNSMIRTILRAMETVRDETIVAEVQLALEAGDIQGAVDALRWELGENILSAEIPVELRTVYETSASNAAIDLERELEAPAVSIRFDIVNPEAVAFIRDHAGELIREFGQSSLEAIRDLIGQAFREGIPPGKLAQMIADSGIGLTSRQVSSIARFRQGLIDAGRSEEQIRRMVERMAQRALKYRARLIARTEIMRASREGSQALWRQAAEKGLIDVARARQKWSAGPEIVGRDGQSYPCPICEALDGIKVRLGEEFPNGAGEGPPRHPACRCVLIMLPFGE